MRVLNLFFIIIYFLSFCFVFLLYNVLFRLEEYIENVFEFIDMLISWRIVGDFSLEFSVYVLGLE